MNLSHPKYGQADASFREAGGEEGIRLLVDSFYDQMRDNPRYQKIWQWHPGLTSDDQQKELSRDKLARFLCSWMGGPKRYQETYGSIQIPRVHKHLKVTEVEKQMWLNCMRDALALQNYPADFRHYLLKQLSVPAEMIRRTCCPV